MILVLFIGFIFIIIFLAVIFKTNKPKQKNETIVIYSSPSPQNTYSYGINPYAKLDKICPTELLKPAQSIIKLCFTENKSKDFETVLTLAKVNKSYFTEGLKHTVCYDFKDWKAFKNIFDIAKKWKNTTVFINNEEADFLQLGKVLKCLADKEKNGSNKWCAHINPNVYDSESNLGCRRLNVGYGSPYAAWYDFLILEEKRFKIDKEEILKQTLKLAETCKHCPYFNSQKIWENYLKIPSAISFNDRRFLCLQHNDGRLEVFAKAYPKETIEETIWPNFKGKILSTK